MHKGFIGDIATFDKPGLGVYVEPILELAKEYVSEEKVKDLSHKRTSANIWGDRQRATCMGINKCPF